MAAYEFRDPVLSSLLLTRRTTTQDPCFLYVVLPMFIIFYGAFPLKVLIIPNSSSQHSLLLFYSYVSHFVLFALKMVSDQSFLLLPPMPFLMQAELRLNFYYSLYSSPLLFQGVALHPKPHAIPWSSVQTIIFFYISHSLTCTLAHACVYMCEYALHVCMHEHIHTHKRTHHMSWCLFYNNYAFAIFLCTFSLQGTIVTPAWISFLLHNFTVRRFILSVALSNFSLHVFPSSFRNFHLFT